MSVAGGTGVSPTKAGSLWRMNTELQHRNEALQLEVNSLRQGVVRRQLTRGSTSSLNSTANKSRAGSMAGEPAGEESRAAQKQLLARLGQQLQEAQRAVVERQAAADQLAQELQAAHAEAAVAQAGIDSVSEQLHTALMERQELRLELGAAQGVCLASLKDDPDAKEAHSASLAALVQTLAALAAGRRAEALALSEDLEVAHTHLEAAHAELRAAQEAQAQLAQAAAASAAQVLNLEQQMADLLHGGAQQNRQGQLGRALKHPEAIAGTSHASSPASPAHSAGASSSGYSAQHPVLPLLASPVTKVAALERRLAEVEAELAEQLAAKQGAHQLLSTQQTELAALCRERDLLREQAVSLQQEVSAYQQGSLLRGGASGAELALERTLKRSPSKTLGSRMKELMGLRRPATSHSISGSRCNSPRSPGAGSSGGASCSRPASPWAMPVVAEASCGSAAPNCRMQAGSGNQELQHCLNQVEALQACLAAKQAEVEAGEAQLQEQQASAVEAVVALAKAQRQFESSTQRLNSRMVAAESAAEAVMQLHGSKVVDLGSEAAARAGVAADASHQECRATMEAIYAQIWRERLGRQKAQAEAVDLRLQLSEQHVAASGSLKAAELDEAVMQSLEEEMKRAHHLSDELRRHKAHQVKLQKRTEQLELQLAEYTTLLSLADEVDQLPRLGGSRTNGKAGSRAGSPVSGASAGSRAGGGSPVRAAITALQVRKATEEAAALREQLKAAQADVAGVRRRERESAVALKTAVARRRDVELQQAALASGLDTLHRLLLKKARGSSTAAGIAGSNRSTGVHSRGGSPSAAAGGAGSALALLSALLQGLQSDDGAVSQAMVSPQLSENGGAAGLGVAGGGMLAMGIEKGEGDRDREAGHGEAQSDPLDISTLLPAGTDGDLTSRACSGAGLEEQLASPTRSCSAEEAGISAVGGLKGKQGATVITLLATSSSSARSLSRIPAAPPAGTGAQQSSSPAGSLGMGGSKAPSGLRKLVLGLQTSCGHMSPRATVSNTREAAGVPAQKGWSPVKAK